VLAETASLEQIRHLLLHGPEQLLLDVPVNAGAVERFLK